MRRCQLLAILLAVGAGGCFPSFGDLTGGNQPNDAARDSALEPVDQMGPCATNADCVAPSVCQLGACGGLVGNYYASENLSGENVIRIDSSIDFNWGYGSPAPGIMTDRFSVRWTGWVTPLYSEMYTFYTTSDDGVVLWVDDVTVVDHWTPHQATEDMGSITLTAGVTHSLKLEYHDTINEAVIKLAWSSTSQPKEIVPTGRLTP